MKNGEWIHRVLDGEIPLPEKAAADTPEAKECAEYQHALDLLTTSAVTAPAALVSQVMAALPAEPDRTWVDLLRRVWPRGQRWFAPALAGALAAILAIAGVTQFRAGPPTDTVAVTFEIHAPGAHEVELVGSFNGWKPGELVLQGPDATGYWTTTVRLPSGRYEYLFLVDGERWITDPLATAHRPDGFGRENALIEL